MKTGKTNVFNILTGITLMATACLVIYYALIGLGVDAINPFPPPTVASIGQHSGATATPIPGPTRPVVPTWTPSPTPTITPTPSPTRTPTPTFTPSPTPTFPPTNTPTPRATRSPHAFTCEVELRRPEYDHWSGVAGHVQDLDGNPLPGYYVQVEGPGETVTVRAGEDSRLNTIYGNQAAWEKCYNPTAYQAMEIRVRLYNDHPEPNGEYKAVSDLYVIQLGGYASGSLGYVICTLNPEWAEWLGIQTPVPTSTTPTPTR